MTKRVDFGPKPAPQPVPARTPDQWVEKRAQEGIKRLTIDIPTSVHSRFKAKCAVHETRMADQIRGFIDEWIS